MPIRTFQRSQLGKVYDINRAGCRPSGIINNSHLFELFGQYSDEDAESVRSDTMERIESGECIYSTVGTVFFARREWTYEEWALTACSSFYYGDELLLYALCRIFHRHAMIVCRDCFWSTIEPEGTMPSDVLMEACDLHLVYLRPGIFGELVPKTKHSQKSSTSIAEVSPPEFPAWSDNNTSFVVHSVPELSGFVDTDLLRTYLNIDGSPDRQSDSQSEPTSQMDNIKALPCKNTPTENTSLTGGNTQKVSDATINGNNITPHLDNIKTLTGGNTSVENIPIIDENAQVLIDAFMSGNSTNPDPRDADTTIGYSNFEPVSHGEIISPTTLKNICIQTLQVNVSVNNPMSLAHICIDYMSWNSSVTFGINMILPNTMSTLHSIAEIRRVPLPSPFYISPSTTKKSVRCGNTEVQKQVHEYWLKDIPKRKYVVQLQKLSKREISLWDKSEKVDAWKDIDPYSDLEDMGNSDHPTSDDGVTSEEKLNVYHLHDRKSGAKEKRISTRPSRRASNSIKYTYSDDTSDSDKHIAKGTPVKKPIKPRANPSGPSKERIAARGKRSIPPLITHPIPTSKPLKAETLESSGSDTEPYDPPNPDSSNPPGVSIKEVPDSKPTEPKKRRVFVTRRVGVKKYRRKRSYKCPVCASNFTSQGDLNDHYRQHHDKVQCSKCSQSFTTPSTLTRHYYTHATPRVFCRCGKGFFFQSELRVHKLLHRRIRTQICTHPGCGKSYFSAADLAKHARIHENIEWKCTKCTYKSYDQRLLRSHQRVHDQIVKHSCAKCGKGFVFYTQWSRHRKSDDCEPLKRSDSPEV